MQKRSRRKRWLYGRWLRAGHFTQSRCKVCGGRLLYFTRYDALCCPGCDAWRERACSDPACEFCAARPPHPGDGLFVLPPTPVSVKYNRIKRYERRMRSGPRRGNYNEHL